MKIIPFLAVVLSLPAAHAADLAKFGEGNAEQRSRLAGIEGAPAVEMNLAEWINSDALKLPDLKGKIVVLDFWATWCGPCIASIPKNNGLAEKYAKDVVIIGVCHPRGAEKMAETVTKHKIAYPVAVDTDGKLSEAYKVNGYPDYYFIDREGKVVLADCSNGSVEDAIKVLLEKE